MAHHEVALLVALLPAVAGVVAVGWARVPPKGNVRHGRG
jgi:hypothetical protein